MILFGRAAHSPTPQQNKIIKLEFIVLRAEGNERFLAANSTVLLCWKHVCPFSEGYLHPAQRLFRAQKIISSC